MDSEIITGKRSIAFFDILGFKDKVLDLSIEELAESYTKLIQNTENYVIDESNPQMLRRGTCKRFIFSDSIFIVASEDSEQGFVDLYTYAWRMMQIAIAMKFPLRGAITYGDIFVEQRKGIFIGESIVKAAIWESKQDWIGAVVDESAVGRYASAFEGEDVLHQITKILLPVYPVPLKDGTSDVQRVINWRTNIISEQGIRSLFENKRNDETVERKIENTLSFAKSIREANIAYFDDKKVPIQYRRLYIADHDPNQGIPTENGDLY